MKASQQLQTDEFIQIKPEHLAGDLGAAMYVHPAQDSNYPKTKQGKISIREEVKLFQIKLIQAALEKNNGNWTAAACSLDTNRSNLHNLATRLGIRKKVSKWMSGIKLSAMVSKVLEKEDD